ncbi:phosphoglycerate kinase [bacterium]|nr:phosphoglycerate kinase [bacterium]
MDYQKKTIEQIEVAGKRVFVRADFNVPLENGKITNDRRIRASLPTIKYLLDKGASVVVSSHLGRPKGKVKPELSLKPVAERLAELLGKPVKFAPDCIGPEVEKMAKELKAGEIMCLENLRFHEEEEKNDPEFTKKLASLADLYVSDAFGTVHRAHASTEGVAHYLRPAVAGFLIAKELKYLGGAMANPKRPLVAILGGAKVGSKIGVINKLMEICDTLVIGGGMAYTFFKAKGYSIGDSLFDAESFETAKQILKTAEEKKIQLVLPLDVVVTQKLEAGAPTQVVPVTAIPDGWAGADSGPKTVAEITRVTKDAGTIVWNGPVGVFEIEQFGKGTLAIAEALAHSGAVTILGGGETAAAAEEYGLDDKMSHVSTGGGASLEFLEGRVLPGIATLDDAR